MKTSNFSILAALAIALLAVPMLGCEGKVSGGSPTGGPMCAAGQTTCGSQCVNAASDPQNCGGCGVICTAGKTCQSGACQCAAGLLNCNGNCISQDAANCGACGNACPTGQVCNGGTCASSCTAPATMCGMGACVNTNGNDPLNCGGCGIACGTGAACNAGACGCSVAGQMLCNGACVDTNTSTRNCGTCNHSCENGQTCTSGVCTGIMTTGTGGTGGNMGTGGSGTGGTGGATGLGGFGGAGASGAPFEPITAAAATRKVKNLLTGLAATDAEIATVTSSGQMGLQNLINSWMSDQATSPLFQDKMVTFFRNFFQQTGFQATEDFKIQLLQNGGFDFGPIGTSAVGDDAFFRLVQNLQDSFALTAWGIVANKQPFSDVLTRQKFMMTTGLKSLYIQIETAADAPYTNQNAQPAWTIDYSGNPITLEAGLAMSPMMFSDDPPANTSGGFNLTPNCRGGAIVASGMFNGTSLLFQRLLGFKPRFPFSGNPTCFEQASKPYFTTADLTDWQWVTITHNSPATMRPPTSMLSYQLPTLRPMTTLPLSLPRVGFYTTPAFLALWNTNDSNQHRVTANQTLLVALGQALSSANSITPLSSAGLDMNHAVAGTECNGCHKLLDPLRQFWAAEYDFNDRNDFPAANRFTGGGANPRPSATGGLLAFDNVNAMGSNMFGLGPLLLQVTDEQVTGNVVSRFAMSVTQQLCYFANSSGCLETDPEFRRVALAFQKDNYQFPTLIRELFSSPLVTNAATTMTTDQNGVTISISRRDQICASLSNRLGIADICSLDVALPSSTQNTTLKIVNSVATDAFSRGSEIPVTPSDPTLFYRAASEMLCENVAGKVVDVSGSMYQSSSYANAISDMASRIVGYAPSDSHYAMAVQILTEHYNNALSSSMNTGSSTAKATNALRSTFALACQSPTSLSFGL